MQQVQKMLNLLFTVKEYLGGKGGAKRDDEVDSNPYVCLKVDGWYGPKTAEAILRICWNLISAVKV